jgi:hypothetical protein
VARKSRRLGSDIGVDMVTFLRCETGRRLPARFVVLPLRDAFHRTKVREDAVFVYGVHTKVYCLVGRRSAEGDSTIEACVCRARSRRAMIDALGALTRIVFQCGREAA